MSSPDDSSLENSSLDWFFAGGFFARLILRSKKIPRGGKFFATLNFYLFDEEFSGEEFSASRDFFRVKNYPAKNTPSEEYS
jgi:hypothetical protein